MRATLCSYTVGGKEKAVGDDDDDDDPVSFSFVSFILGIVSTLVLL